MTLPTTSPLNGNDDDSDMFGPPRSSPVGYHQRSRVPMISPKLRQREERKRILQLCAHKLERIKDSEANLRRSVCINNTYSRLTDEVRREKQSRYLANLPKSETKPETAHDNIYSPYHHSYNNQMELRNESYHKINHQESFNNNNSFTNKNTPYRPSVSSSLTTSSGYSSHESTGGGGGGLHHSPHSTTSTADHHSCYLSTTSSPASLTSTSSLTCSSYALSSQTKTITSSYSSLTTTASPTLTTTTTSLTSSLTSSSSHSSSSSSSSSSVDTDLEILDRELNAINASMPLIDPEITQGAEQLEKAVSSRKRSRTEEENDRLVREALSQFYLPTQRLISAIDDYPPDLKRTRYSAHSCSLTGTGHMLSSTCSSTTTIGELDLDHLGLDVGHHQSQNGFDVIMDALRLSTSSPTPSAQDSCGQAAMMSESGVFHNLVVTSLET